MVHALIQIVLRMLFFPTRTASVSLDIAERDTEICAFYGSFDASNVVRIIYVAPPAPSSFLYWRAYMR